MGKAILLTSILLASASLLNAQRASVTKVFEYKPAPGQFINVLPTYTNGDDEEAICDKCLESLDSSQLISLGGFGGYIVVGFDHSIINRTGEYDFIINANAMDNNGEISSEPGIVLVSADVNNNGLPDSLPLLHGLRSHAKSLSALHPPVLQNVLHPPAQIPAEMLFL